jgi:hypothetical protein
MDHVPVPRSVPVGTAHEFSSALGVEAVSGGGGTVAMMPGGQIVRPGGPQSHPHDFESAFRQVYGLGTKPTVMEVTFSQPSVEIILATGMLLVVLGWWLVRMQLRLYLRGAWLARYNEREAEAGQRQDLTAAS